MRRLATVLVAAAVAVSLTSCDPSGVFSQPSLMRVVDGDVELMVCDSYEPATIEGFVKSADGVRTYFWEASSGRSLEPGDLVSTDALDELFEEVVMARVPAPALGENVAVYLGEQDGGYLKLFSFVVTSEMLDGVWVSSWGESVPEATCEVGPRGTAER